MAETYIMKCGCGKQFKVDDAWLQEWGGKKIRCPGCKAVISVPKPAPAVQPTPAPAAETTEEESPADAATEGQEGGEALAEEEEAPPARGPLSVTIGDMTVEFEDPTETDVAPEESVGMVPNDLAQEEGQGIAPPADGPEPQPQPQPQPAATEEPPAAAAAPAAVAEEGGEVPAAAGDHEETDPSDLTKCPHCATKVEPGTVFCVHCGTDLKTGRKLRRAKAENEGGGYEYDPPTEGACRYCSGEDVMVIEVPRQELMDSKRFMKAVRKGVGKKSVSDKDMQIAASVRIGGGESITVCESCARELKVGPKKFSDLTPEEEAPEDEDKKKGGLFGKLFGKKKAGGGSG